MSKVLSASDLALCQAAYEKACNGIIKQGFVSKTTEGGCKYRSPSGGKCAIGQLMTNEQMSLHGIHEGTNVFGFHSQLMLELLPLGAGFLTARAFLYSLQMVHDSLMSGNPDTFVSDFKEGAVRFAGDWNLKPIG